MKIDHDESLYDIHYSLQRFEAVQYHHPNQQKKDPKRLGIGMMIFSRLSTVEAALLLLCVSSFSFSVQGFTAPFRSNPTNLLTPNNNHVLDSESPVATSTRLNMIEWESVVFNAESTANELARFSLEDPSNLFTSLPIMYGAGLLTSVSPCVWGLLPLTISYISTAAGERDDKQTTLPTLAFAAGLAVVFCSLGITAAQLGNVFGDTGSNSVFLPLFSNTICFAMGLQLLGLIDLPLPSLDMLKNANPMATSSDEPILIDATGQIINTSKKEDEGSLFRTFLLGGSSALVASPCATPVLTSILAFVAKAQNPALGALLLLGYTLGYSTPLLLIASTGGQALVDLKQQSRDSGSIYGKIAPWVTPLTGGILLWYGTNGLLTALFGDPSMAGLVTLE